MPNSQLQIRAAKHQEAVLVQRLNDGCGLGNWPAADYAAATRLHDFALRVAVYEGALVGFYLARLVGTDLELLKLAVEPSLRRQGIASGLLASCLDWGRRSMCEACYLEVRKSNVPAIRLYERHGFHTIGTRRHYYQDPVEDALVMTSDLDVESSMASVLGGIP